jgi:hypothetical protein
LVEIMVVTNHQEVVSKSLTTFHCKRIVSKTQYLLVKL